MDAQQWQKQGFYQRINGHQVFTIDSGQNAAKDLPVLCVLHGFPTSSYDYHKVLPTLSQYYRVIIHDHIGFGFSDKPLKYSYSLIDQTDMALALWKSLGISHAIVLAHDYGSSILTEILARDNFAKKYGFDPHIHIDQVFLCNGSIHIEMARLLLMQKLLRHTKIGPLLAKLSSKSTLKRNLKKIYFNPKLLTDQELDSIWYIMNFNQGKQVLAKISQYTIERMKLWHRWINALQETKLPIKIIWPDSDPIAIDKMADTIHQETQNSELVWLKDLGHFPMLENPRYWVSILIKSLHSDDE